MPSGCGVRRSRTEPAGPSRRNERVRAASELASTGRAANTSRGGFGMSRTSEFTGHSQADAAHGSAGTAAAMMQATPADAARAQQDVLRGLDGKQACPFCGAVAEKSPNPCARCGMDNTPEARRATKARIGPWYVLQARNPAAPGMRFDTLLTFVRKGRVRARSV